MLVCPRRRARGRGHRHGWPTRAGRIRTGQTRPVGPGRTYRHHGTAGCRTLPPAARTRTVTRGAWRPV